MRVDEYSLRFGFNGDRWSVSGVQACSTLASAEGFLAILVPIGTVMGGKV